MSLRCSRRKLCLAEIVAGVLLASAGLCQADDSTIRAGPNRAFYDSTGRVVLSSSLRMLSDLTQSRATHCRPHLY